MRGFTWRGTCALPPTARGEGCVYRRDGCGPAGGMAEICDRRSAASGRRMCAARPPHAQARCRNTTCAAMPRVPRYSIAGEGGNLSRRERERRVRQPGCGPAVRVAGLSVRSTIRLRSASESRGRHVPTHDVASLLRRQVEMVRVLDAFLQAYGRLSAPGYTGLQPRATPSFLQA
jgi:hypothetical protein